MSMELPHERLDIYRLYLDVASLCGALVSSIASPIAVLDHLDRAMESIGVNLRSEEREVVPGSFSSS